MGHSIFFVSDGTAITAETLGRALLTQFEGIETESHVLRFVGDAEQAYAAITQINEAAQRDGARPVVFSTLVDPQVRAIIESSQAHCFDLFATFVPALQDVLGEPAAWGAMGRSHGQMDRTDYDTRMDAVNFALTTDDGAGEGAYEHADVILVGVSRSGKTPTSLYLALRFGAYAANYPITEHNLETLKLPATLQSYRDKLFGLTIRPERLQQIRQGRRPGSRYASARQCRSEIQQVEALYRKNGIEFVDTTSLSVEEIATMVLHRRAIGRRLY